MPNYISLCPVVRAYLTGHSAIKANEIVKAIGRRGLTLKKIF